ncbi:hypothetical protein [Syntrophomonas erecta]
MGISKLLLVAVLAESIWEALKRLWEQDKISLDHGGALVISIILAIAIGIDFFVMFDIPIKIPYLGQIFTGIIISRGANFMHDLISIVEGIKGGVKTK